MKTYIFQVELQPDGNGWLITCPALYDYAAYTWGYTVEDALTNIREVIEMIIEELLEDNLPIPAEAALDSIPDSGQLDSSQRVAVSV